MSDGARLVRSWLIVVSGLAGAMSCGGAAANHERLGDRAYVARHFSDAVVEYRIALKQRAPTPALRAKTAAAALHAGDLTTAAEEYRALAKAGPSHRTEAADGLERVARAAVTGDDRAGLSAALVGLRDIAAGRAFAAFAREFAQTLGPDARSADLINVLAFAAAGAPDARQEDSLMYVYGSALERGGHCETAIPVFEGVSRRQRNRTAATSAEQAARRCELQLGQKALEQGAPQRAEDWFRRAATGGENGDPIVRAAYIGLGDVLFARAAFGPAAEAYQQAMTGAQPGDSLAQVAAEKLNMVANAGTVVR